MVEKFKHGVLGGTFDHLHIGHQKLIDVAFSQSCKVSIGICLNSLCQNKFLSHIIESFKDREENVLNYLTQKNYLNCADISPLNDIFGPTLSNNDIDAIFVTLETLGNARIINSEREKKGLKPLEIIQVPYVKDETGEVISSERIRLGEIDREGAVYLDIFKNKSSLKLPADLREKLRHPLGDVIKETEQVKKYINHDSMIITVGDIVSKTLKEIGIIPDLEIIDLKNRRAKLDDTLTEEYKNMRPLKNEAGTIQKQVIIEYGKLIRHFVKSHEKQKILIDGEEDLLALPAILLAPLNSFVCYGQFDLNALILVKVTESNKKNTYDLLRQFN